MGAVPSLNAEQMLVVDVLCAELVGTREYRVFDTWTVSIVGQCRPYVQVSFRGQDKETAAATFFFRWSMIRPLFNKPLKFPIDPAGSVSEDQSTIRFTVRDTRHWQGMLRGDPMFGECTLTVDPAADGKQPVRLELHQPDGTFGGWLEVKYKVIDYQANKTKFENPSDHPLLVILETVVDALLKPEGVSLLLDSKPAIARRRVDCVNRDHARVEKLRDELRQATERVDGGASDERVLDCDEVRAVAHEILKFVADTAWREGMGPASDTIALAVEWAREFFRMVSELLQPPSLERIERFFASADFREQDLVPCDRRSGQEVDTYDGWSPGAPPPPAAKLGSGTFGTVWLARDRNVKQLFAVKRMETSKPVTWRELQVVEEMKAEAHPCIVSLMCVHIHPDLESCSLVMEFCPEGDLQGKIKNGWSSQGYTAPAAAMTWVWQIFLGLEYLHGRLRRKLLHRDVNPKNVLLTHGDRAKLADFGFSRLAGTSDGVFTFGTPPGTPMYIAPEVVREGVGYDHRADLFSFAALVLVTLTGGWWNGGEPIPPCASFDQKNGDRLEKLLDNWRVMKRAIEDPATEGVKPLPSEDAKDFVLSLTYREDADWELRDLGHEFVRQHPFMREAALPVAGDWAAVVQWLEDIDRPGQPTP